VFLKVPELREQDFGLFEGVPYGAFNGSGKDPRRASIETSNEMAVRARSFIAEYLMPTIKALGDQSASMAIVSHGCMLRVLWRELLARFRPSNVQCEQVMLRETQSIDYARIGHWSNTGYLQVDFNNGLAPVLLTEAYTERSQRNDVKSRVRKVESARAAHPTWTARILAVNETGHLKTLKRTKGGIGSSRYDAKQGTLDKFLKQVPG